MKVTWLNFKDIVKVKNSIRYITLEDKYDIWIDLGRNYVECTIDIEDPKNSDQLDFELNYKPYSNILNERLTTEGNIVSSSTYSVFDLCTRWKKRKHIAIAGQINFFDIEITSEVRLISGSYYIKNYPYVHDDDFIEFSVIDKNDVLGLFSTYGLTIAVDILELKKFVSTEYPEESYEFITSLGNTFPVFRGLFLRIAYNSYGTTNINFQSRLLYFEE